MLPSAPRRNRYSPLSESLSDLEDDVRIDLDDFKLATSAVASEARLPLAPIHDPYSLLSESLSDLEVEARMLKGDLKHPEEEAALAMTSEVRLPCILLTTNNMLIELLRRSTQITENKPI